MIWDVCTQRKPDKIGFEVTDVEPCDDFPTMARVSTFRAASLLLLQLILVVVVVAYSCCCRCTSNASTVNLVTLIQFNRADNVLAA